MTLRATWNLGVTSFYSDIDSINFTIKSLIAPDYVEMTLVHNSITDPSTEILIINVPQLVINQEELPETSTPYHSTEFTLTYTLASIPSDKLAADDIFATGSTGGRIVD